MWGIWVYRGEKLELWGHRDTQTEATEALRQLEAGGFQGHVGRLDF